MLKVVHSLPDGADTTPVPETEAFLTSRDRSVLESDHIAGVLACGWV